MVHHYDVCAWWAQMFLYRLLLAYIQRPRNMEEAEAVAGRGSKSAQNITCPLQRQHQRQHPSVVIVT